MAIGFTLPRSLSLELLVWLALRLERWLLAAALLSGWLLAQPTEIPYARVALWNSLFAGMLIYFVIKNA